MDQFLQGKSQALGMGKWQRAYETAGGVVVDLAKFWLDCTDGSVKLDYEGRLHSGVEGVAHEHEGQTAWVWLNRYTTTVHAINSCVLKASKLTRACTVYRGFAGGTLPDEVPRSGAQTPV